MYTSPSRESLDQVTPGHGMPPRAPTLSPIAVINWQPPRACPVATPVSIISENSIGGDWFRLR